jgi:hypothetical protein
MIADSQFPALSCVLYHRTPRWRLNGRTSVSPFPCRTAPLASDESLGRMGAVPPKVSQTLQPLRVLAYNCSLRVYVSV